MVGDLVEELGRLPLALGQAAAVNVTQRTSYARTWNGCAA